MPIQLPTTFGKTDYNVVLALKQLTAAVDHLEATATRSIDPAEITRLKAQVRELQDRVDNLNRQVNA